MSGTNGIVCEGCGAGGPDHGGQWWHCVVTGWSVAPYPAEYVHEDGTTGDRYVCPSCYAQARGGVR